MKRCFRFAFVAAASVVFASMGSAQISVFTADLSGPAESPPNASPGTGFTTVTMNSILYSMRVQASFQDLVGTTTAAHIHAPTPTPFSGVAAVATELPSFTGFPLGVTSGVYDHTFDMTATSSWSSTFLSNHGGNTIVAYFAFLDYMNQGRTYLNIHSTTYGGGEIRGFLAVPEPASMIALGIGAAALLRRRKKSA